MEETKSLTVEHPKTVFWSRFISWTLFACVLPVSFIVWRFDLFSNTHMAFGGWGIIAVLIIFFFARSLLNYARAGLKKHIFVSQCISGFCKIILPLIGLYFVLWIIDKNIEVFLQALGCVILCEAIAIPINPMPQWVHDNTDGEYEAFADYMWDKVFSRKEDK